MSGCCPLHGFACTGAQELAQAYAAIGGLLCEPALLGSRDTDENMVVASQGRGLQIRSLMLPETEGINNRSRSFLEQFQWLVSCHVPPCPVVAGCGGTKRRQPPAVGADCPAGGQSGKRKSRTHPARNTWSACLQTSRSARRDIRPTQTDPNNPNEGASDGMFDQLKDRRAWRSTRQVSQYRHRRGCRIPGR